MNPLAEVHRASWIWRIGLQDPLNPRCASTHWAPAADGTDPALDIRLVLCVCVCAQPSSSSSSPRGLQRAEHPC